LHNPGEIAPRECFRLGVKIELRILLSSGHDHRPHPEERACAHLEGWATGDTEASWFETREDALLTMRVTERDACALPPLGYRQPDLLSIAAFPGTAKPIMVPASLPQDEAG
jgi:hypothetical protein